MTSVVRSKARPAWPAVAAAIAFLLLWWLVARWMPHQLVASPLASLEALLVDLQTRAFYANFGITLYRVLAGFLLSVAAGVGLGVLFGLRPAVERALGIWVTVALTVPSLFYVIISFMVIGPTETSAIIAIAATAFPLVLVNVSQGVKALDPGLGEMAKLYRLPPSVRLVRIVLPQLAPYIVAAARFGLSTVWKITIFVELIGRSTGVGYMMYYWFQLFQMDQVFAWTGAFTIFMVAVEVGLLRPLERRLFRWRGEAAL